MQRGRFPRPAARVSLLRLYDHAKAITDDIDDLLQCQNLARATLVDRQCIGAEGSDKISALVVLPKTSAFLNVARHFFQVEGVHHYLPFVN